MALRDVLVGEALRDLDGAGLFVLQAPNVAGTEQIGREVAEQFARALLARYAPLGGLPNVNEQHGSPVDQGSLKTCQRTLYAKSPWQSLSPSVARTIGGGVAQRAHGPYWLVPFCDSVEALSMLVSVSAYSGELSIEDGKIVLPSDGGEWFHWRGIPRTQKRELPTGPEQAAELAAKLTGARVVAVPELIAPRRSDGFPSDGRWLIRLDAAAEVVVSGTGRKATVSGLYVGYRPRESGSTIDIPSVEQPSSQDVPTPTDEATGAADKRPPTFRTLTMVRDPSTPVVFDIITKAAAVDR